MASPGAQKRLAKEYKALSEDPIPFIYARPEEANILGWHYIITGPTGTPYEGGQYHGMIIFPREYPFRPPSIKMITPNGRFSPNARLCLTISDYHPESWNPAWSVGTILNGLLSFMTGNDITSGSISTTEAMKKKLAQESRVWNTKNKLFMKVLSDFADVGETRVVAAQSPLDLENRRTMLKRKLEDLKKSNGTTTPTPSTSGEGELASPTSAIETVDLEDEEDAGSRPRKLATPQQTGAVIDLLSSDIDDLTVEKDEFDDFYDDYEPFDNDDDDDDNGGDDYDDDVVEVDKDGKEFIVLD